MTVQNILYILIRFKSEVIYKAREAMMRNGGNMTGTGKTTQIKQEIYKVNEN